MTNEDVAEALADWRQGDVVLGTVALPILDVGEEGDEATLYETEGALLLTQSCDIVRDYDRKPFLHVAFLQEVSEDDLRRIELGREIRYLYIPSLRNRRLVADLDLTATVDKRVLLSRERLAGCASDGERRTLAAGIARHRQRFAFPNDFNDALKPLRRWVEGGHGKDSDKGRFIDAIQEIRVSTVSWEPAGDLEFICIIPSETLIATRRAWLEFLPSLAGKATEKWGRDCHFRLSTYREMTAEDYLLSDRLDFDGLSDA